MGRQGNCATGRCTIALSLHADAKFRMDFRSRAENPVRQGHRMIRSGRRVA